MEESDGFADTFAGEADRDGVASLPHLPQPLLDAGRLGGFLCQLQRARFDGVVHIECDARSASIGLRAGVPVTFDDPAPGHTLGDQLVERGQLTREQCSVVLARMTDGLVEDEAVAFCEHAVQLGYLSEEDATAELSSRIRARMIQLFALRDCETIMEPGLAALLERREFPQNLGAIVYMGVRTFYEEEFLVRCHPDLDQTYVQLLAAPPTIAHFFSLDDEEFKMLRRLSPLQPVSQLLEDRRIDRAHVLALLLLLRLAEFCEVSNVPFSRQPSFGQAPARNSSASGAQDAASVRPDPLPDPPAPRPSAKPVVDATQEALLEAAARTARMRRPGPARRHSKQPEAPAAPSASRILRENHATSSSSPEASARTARANAPAAQPAVRPDYAKAHLKELIARRKHAAAAAPAVSAATSNSRDAEHDLREARSLLHAQQHSRAEKLLAPLAEREPDNEIVKAYLLWSRWRAQPEAADMLAGELRELAKKLLSMGDHAAFAAYMLGHLYLHAKRDDLAEKFFRRAHTADRNNKDAQRYLLILERRKQSNADDSANRKIFGIQISGPKKT